MQEYLPNSSEKSIEDQVDLVALTLKEKGADNPEARSLLINFIDLEEAAADHSKSGHARIGLGRLFAKVYLKAGYKDEGIASLEAALMQASGEEDPDIWDAIMAELVKVKGES